MLILAHDDTASHFSICTDTFMKSVHSWIEESACNVSTFLPSDSKASFSGENTQGTIIMP